MHVTCAERLRSLPRSYVNEVRSMGDLQVWPACHASASMLPGRKSRYSVTGLAPNKVCNACMSHVQNDCGLYRDRMSRRCAAWGIWGIRMKERAVCTALFACMRGSPKRAVFIAEHAGRAWGIQWSTSTLSVEIMRLNDMLMMYSWVRT
jgi:hypothetical protein